MKRIALLFIIFCAVCLIALYPVLKKRLVKNVEDKNFRVFTERLDRLPRDEDAGGPGDPGDIRNSPVTPYEGTAGSGEKGVDLFELLHGVTAHIVDVVEWLWDNLLSQARGRLDGVGSAESPEDSTAVSKDGDRRKDKGFRVFTDRARELGRDRDSR